MYILNIHKESHFLLQWSEKQQMIVGNRLRNHQWMICKMFYFFYKSRKQQQECFWIFLKSVNEKIKLTTQVKKINFYLLTMFFSDLKFFFRKTVHLWYYWCCIKKYLGLDLALIRSWVLVLFYHLLMSHSL